MAGAPAAQSSSSQKPLGAAHGPTSTDGETRSAASDDELTDNGCDHPAAVVQRGSSAGGINDGGGGGGAAREGDVAAGPADEIVAPPSPLPADLDPESDESDEWEVVSGGSCDYHHFLELSPVVGRSAWDLAIAAENLSAVQAMVDDGYDVDTRDPFPGRRLFSPLHWAAQHDNMEAAEILIRGGAHASTTDLYGDTPLHISSEEGYFEVSRILVAGGAAVNARNDLQQTPLHLVSSFPDEGAAEATVLLLEAGADEALRDYEGLTAADSINFSVEIPEDAKESEQVLKLIEGASAEKAWKRRRIWMLCRARLLNQTTSVDTADAGKRMAREGGCPLADAPGAHDDRYCKIVARMVALEEEGIFRTIVGYL
ncbi:unnamed protein product [Ectocarpus fasciculatus]